MPEGNAGFRRDIRQANRRGLSAGCWSRERQGDGKTERQRDRETERQRDRRTEYRLAALCLHLSVSPSLRLSVSPSLHRSSEYHGVDWPRSFALRRSEISIWLAPSAFRPAARYARPS